MAQNENEAASARTQQGDSQCRDGGTRRRSARQSPRVQSVERSGGLFTRRLRGRAERRPHGRQGSTVQAARGQVREWLLCMAETLGIITGGREGLDGDHADGNKRESGTHDFLWFQSQRARLTTTEDGPASFGDSSSGFGCDLMVIVRCSHFRHCRPFWFLSQFDLCFRSCRFPYIKLSFVRS